MKTTPELDFTIEVAQEAGKILMGFFGGKLTHSIKTRPDDFATEADVAAEQYIIDAIKERFPEDAFVAEESGKQGNAEHTWIIDPLDGTKQFSEGRDHFGVMIVRAQGDELQLAVVYNPARSILAIGQKGMGVFLNNETVTLSEVDLGDKPLSVERDDQETLKSIGLGVTNFGASANTLDTISGERRAYVSSNGSVWDWAPPAFLLSEAGFVVTDFSGQVFNWRTSRGVIAAQSELHQELLALLNK